ncbi:MAG: hypothetical protein GY820_25120 [Gammaproteobacteria bacterium]|nr:hypothetical protein [Gammaproteobacteria bacterium]
MKLCQQCGEAKLTDIASEFHVGHYSTVSQTIGRLNKLMKEDAGLAKEFNMLSQDLTIYFQLSFFYGESLAQSYQHRDRTTLAANDKTPRGLYFLYHIYRIH